MGVRDVTFLTSSEKAGTEEEGTGSEEFLREGGEAVSSRNLPLYTGRVRGRHSVQECNLPALRMKQQREGRKSGR